MDLTPAIDAIMSRPQDWLDDKTFLPVEIGGRPDIWYTCDICEDTELDEGPRIFQYNNQHVCEFCLEKLFNRGHIC